MTTFHRALLAVLFAAWLAMPSVGDEGGENASGGGVWILPCAAVVDESALGAGQDRGTLVAHPVSAGLRMQVSSNMGTASAVLVSSLSSEPLPLAVNGSSVVLSKQLLQALTAGKCAARIMIVDAQLNGYIIDLTIDAAGAAVTLCIR